MGSDFNRLRRRDRLHFAIDTAREPVYKLRIRRVDCLISNPFVSGLRIESQGTGGRLLQARFRKDSRMRLPVRFHIRLLARVEVYFGTH